MSTLVERLREYSKDWRDRARSNDVVVEAADRIEELEQAARLVEEWWLEQGSAHFAGAPYAIFALRSVLSDSTPSLLQEQNANPERDTL
ncbi:hypothetical protein [Rhizobium sp.]|uniref:hypothetical protein n=1 Tax=Rhizobium sp. TaxID=391 RepID=UPI003F81B6DC